MRLYLCRNDVHSFSEMNRPLLVLGQCRLSGALKPLRANFGFWESGTRNRVSVFLRTIGEIPIYEGCCTTETVRAVTKRMFRWKC